MTSTDGSRRRASGKSSLPGCMAASGVWHRLGAVDDAVRGGSRNGLLEAEPSRRSAAQSRTFRIHQDERYGCNFATVTDPTEDVVTSLRRRRGAVRHGPTWLRMSPAAPRFRRTHDPILARAGRLTRGSSCHPATSRVRFATQHADARPNGIRRVHPGHGERRFAGPARKSSWNTRLPTSRLGRPSRACTAGMNAGNSQFLPGALPGKIQRPERNRA